MSKTIFDLGRYKTALENHLCPYDLTDWLHCAGNHGDVCIVCEEAGEHEHEKWRKHDERIRAETRLEEAKYWRDNAMDMDAEEADNYIRELEQELAK